jgi:hypothetical protein
MIISKRKGLKRNNNNNNNNNNKTRLTSLTYSKFAKIEPKTQLCADIQRFISTIASKNNLFERELLPKPFDPFSLMKLTYIWNMRY